MYNINTKLHSALAKKGRASAINPLGRFKRQECELDPEALEEEEIRKIDTHFHRERSQRLITKNDSPDLGFAYSINAYRGCEHGCIYCYARPSHEYWGYSAGLDFETEIIVKDDPATLLREELSKSSWNPQVILLSGNTDPYQPAERIFRNTRSILETLREFKNPVHIITKNYRVTKDLDLLSEMANEGLLAVTISLTTLDGSLSSKMEPRASTPERRLHAISKLSKAGIPVRVNIAPVVPGLTDEEIPSILSAAKACGAKYANYIILRLPGSVKTIFQEWLRREYPERESKVIERIRSLRNGGLNDSRFSFRMKGEGIWADTIRQVFDIAISRNELEKGVPELRTDQFRNVELDFRNQLDLFVGLGN